MNEYCSNRILGCSIMDLKHIALQAVEAVREVGSFVSSKKECFGEVKYKDIKNPLTIIDVQAEELMVKKLRTILPEAGFIVEEGETNLAGEYNWTIDPIDGTKYFSTFFPVFYVQIALLKKDEPILSVVYNPVASQMFYAIKGHGAYLNGVRKQIEYDGPLKNALVNLEISYIGDDIKKQEIMLKVAGVARRMMLVSTVFIPYVLTNTIQAYIRFIADNRIYDLAPREILLKEAGCTYKKYFIGDKLLIIAAHPILVREIETLLGVYLSV